MVNVKKRSASLAVCNVAGYEKEKTGHAFVTARSAPQIPNQS